ncbi:MAG: hypothetical protein KGL53_04895, partial [Elusimicrobia bacterium]|nr:hypothetical protein [Elusimicrobiota bacterium]
GVLGTRRALRGYVGEVPESVKPGDLLDILNLGGVIGRCTSANPELGAPLKAEVLGAVLSFPFLGERTGVPASIRTKAVPMAETLAPCVPVVYVAGTCMNSGKTYACGEIIRYLSKRGLKVFGAKLTGVALRRDALHMLDRGADRCLTFNDAGMASTSEALSVPVAKGLFNALNEDEPDVLVVELGDGILGEYGVQAILEDAQLMAAASIHVLCAADPVAAWGAVELYRNRFKLTPGILSGPATDNAVGNCFIAEKLGVGAYNARTQAEELGAAVFAAVSAAKAGKKEPVAA